MKRRDRAISSKEKRARVVALGTMAFGVGLWAYALELHADDSFSCRDETGRECTFQLQDNQIQKVPPVFKFQSRISQAKFPVGNAEFSQLVIKVETVEGRVVCQEQFSKVKVRDSVLNLEIGRMMTCK